MKLYLLPPPEYLYHFTTHHTPYTLLTTIVSINAPTDSKSTFLAHDTPGFGFNPRPRSDVDVMRRGLFPTIYRPLWGAKASLSLAADNENEPPVAQRIFMGHSMGSVSAMAAAASTVLQGTSNVRG